MNQETRSKLTQTRYYSWIPWFRELASNIVEGGENYLVEKAKQVNWTPSSYKGAALLNFSDEGIDPFSFFYFLAAKNAGNVKNKNKNLKITFRSVHDVFELPDELRDICPTESNYFPTPVFKLLFHGGKTFYRELLWELFRQVTKDDVLVNEAHFLKVLSIKNVGVSKLTQCLFLINPYEFIPIDKHVGKAFFKDEGNVENQIKRGGYSTYTDFALRIKQRFPKCESYEINQFVYLLYRFKVISPKSNLHQLNTDVNSDGEDHWAKFDAQSCILADRSNPTLQVPKRGDVVFARFGSDQGRGIGVVLKNEHRDSAGNNEQSVIHVNWINKESSQMGDLESNSQLSEIQNNSQIYSEFANGPSYKETLNLIEKFRPPPSPPPPQPVPSDFSLNTILYGPPGSGKTYATTQRCVEICNGTSERSNEQVRREFDSLVQTERVQFVTFHQSYSYEEFVEGLRPTPDRGGGFQLDPIDGVLKRVAERARNNQNNDHYVLVIDEINRANISKVLGELITLLEEDKREGMDNEITLTLPYSGKNFSLPQNLYILGTMNTADRSIALLDTALRRRFDFEEMMPKPDLLDRARESTQVDLPEVLRTINKRIEYLKDRDHLIGHAWLMNAKDRDDLDQIMRNKIIPLIAEYFHDDWQNVRAILGGTDDFVTSEKLSVPPGLEAAYEHRYSWKINEEFREDAYANLISGKKSDTN